MSAVVYIYDLQHFTQCCEYIHKNNIFGTNVIVRDIEAVIASLGGIDSADAAQDQLALNPIDIGLNAKNDSILEVFRLLCILTAIYC